MTYMEALDALEQLLTDARNVPLSASAMIPREDALTLVRQIRDALPAEHQQAREVMDEREKILTEAHEQRAYIIEQAREERTRLLTRAEVVQAAEEEAKRIVGEAQGQAERLAHQADDYADAKMEALRAHRTQISVDGPFFALSNNKGNEIWGTEFFRIAKGEQGPVGPDGLETDLFAGLS